jgi:hypothetical protein
MKIRHRRPTSPTHICTAAATTSGSYHWRRLHPTCPRTLRSTHRSPAIDKGVARVPPAKITLSVHSSVTSIVTSTANQYEIIVVSDIRKVQTSPLPTARPILLDWNQTYTGKTWLEAVRTGDQLNSARIEITGARDVYRLNACAEKVDTRPLYERILSPVTRTRVIPSQTPVGTPLRWDDAIDGGANADRRPVFGVCHS